LVYGGSFVVVVAVYLSLAAVTIGAAASGVDLAGPAGLVQLMPGSTLGLAVTAVMLLVILANANAWVFGASRLVYSAGRQGPLPGFLGQLSQRQVPLPSLGSMLAVYLAVIAIVSSGIVRLDTLIALVSQNFLVLYAFCIVAFLRTETGWSRWPTAAMAAGACVFFLSGFGWWILYPTFLLAIGYVTYRWQASAQRYQLSSQNEPYSGESY
jgi:amino acid transporter